MVAALIGQRLATPADTGVSAVTWVSGGFCVYFTCLSLVYWSRAR